MFHVIETQDKQVHVPAEGIVTSCHRPPTTDHLRYQVTTLQGCVSSSNNLIVKYMTRGCNIRTRVPETVNSRATVPCNLSGLHPCLALGGLGFRDHKVNRTLIDVTLFSNQIGDEGAKALANSLKATLVMWSLIVAHAVMRITERVILDVR